MPGRKTKGKRALLPKHPPKRTGKRGPRPLDAKDDFDKPAKKKDQTLHEAARQARLPGMEDAAISDIERAARRYKNVQVERMAFLKQELELKEALQTVMKRHGKEIYRHDDMLVVASTKENVKVTISDDDAKLDAAQADAARTTTDAPQETANEAQANDDAKKMEESLDPPF